MNICIISSSINCTEMTRFKLNLITNTDQMKLILIITLDKIIKSRYNQKPES